MDVYKTHGAFSWNELTSTDPAAAADFSLVEGLRQHQQPHRDWLGLQPRRHDRRRMAGDSQALRRRRAATAAVARGFAAQAAAAGWRLQVLDLFRKPIYHVRLLETLDNLFPKP